VALILNIETATRNCSVTLARDGQLIALRELATDGYAHAEKLHVFIEETMREAGCNFPDLDAVAVSKGPGSYTGLRIGVSAAKGFCYALGIPLISVGTLDVLASKIRVGSGVIAPMLDARRMEVYSALFDAGHRQIRETQAEIIDENSFSEISGEIHVAGDCQEKLQSVLTGSKFHFHPEAVFPSAREMAPMAEARFLTSTFEDVAYFEPFYLKDFIAGKKA